MDDIVLIDLDSTVADHDGQIGFDLEKLRSPDEPSFYSYVKGNKLPDYLFNRMNLIRSTSAWWENLPVIPRGMALVNLVKEIGFRIVVLTQGPKVNPAAWEGKVKWVNKNMPFCSDIVITRDKGLVYGKVLIDDYPEYIEKWVAHRPRGLVIMPDFNYNRTFTTNHLVRYEDVHQLLDIEKVLLKVKNRKIRDKLEM